MSAEEKLMFLTAIILSGQDRVHAYMTDGEIYGRVHTALRAALTVVKAVEDAQKKGE